jgi:uncharacterized protein (DUF433 family)
VTPEDLKGDLVLSGDPLFGVVWINPARMSGAPCFYGTRVPIKHLFDYLRAGHAIADFFEDFPGVTRQQVDHLLRQAEAALVAGFASCGTSARTTPAD